MVSDLVEVLASGGRGVCPECGGGTTGERCLKVWQYDGFMYAKCYRNTCGKRWKFLGSVPVGTYEKQAPRMVYKAFVEDGGLLSRVAGLVGEPKPVEIQGRDGLCYELRNPSGDLKGWNIRHTDGRSPKSTLVYTSSQPGVREIGWFTNVKQASQKPLVVVEDCASALLASRYLPSVALCGTYLTLDSLSDILDERGRSFNGHLIFALDRDAYTKALMYESQFRCLTQTSSINLTNDIKDMSDPEIKELLNGYAT